MTDPTVFPLEGGCDCRHVRYRMQTAPLFVHCCHCDETDRRAVGRNEMKEPIVMAVDTVTLSLQNPVFQTYLVAASLMILKLMLQPWMTVVRMTKARGGFRSPEDATWSSLAVIAMATYVLLRAL